MGLLDRLFGRSKQQQYPAGQQYQTQQPRRQGTGSGASEDERAIARYTYLLRTAPPEELEKIHAEAFAKLTPEQRQQVLQRLSQDMPAAEKPTSDDPTQLARAATRMEMRNPGYMRSSFMGGGMGMGGMGMGGTIASSMFGSIAGVVIGSAIADAMFDDYDNSPEAAEAGDSQADVSADAADNSDAGDTGDAGDSGMDGSGDFLDDGSAAGDTGSDFSDTGSDFGGFDGGGADFGGGDFGGGDFGGGDF